MAEVARKNERGVRIASSGLGGLYRPSAVDPRHDPLGGRKRVLLIAAAILAARKLANRPPHQSSMFAFCSPQGPGGSILRG